MSLNFTAGSFPGIAPNLTSITQCTVELCSLDYAVIRYLPNFAGNVLYLSCFALLLVTHAVQCCVYRTYSYTFSMIAGFILEIIGYLGRIQMHNNPFLSNPFLLYIICLTIGPVFFTAALYITLSRVIVFYGTQYSRLSPKAYTLTFITFDIIALVLQALGGALADTADTPAGSRTGINIMIAGLAFQVASLLGFVVLCAEFFYKVHKSPRMGSRGENGVSLRFLIIAFALATLFILIRSTFRMAELYEGFDGKLANEQAPFMIFEGAMIIFATALMTAFHPGRYLSKQWGVAGWNFRKSKRQAGAGSGGKTRISSLDETRRLEMDRY
ncbi:RTA1 like protein [Phlyctema vagabunda]|uniref:RTA1 like protein n=1 Tax=Phlyctema vagabunda TaxID=108571 RepID=A0ABR4PD31_9HELO